MTSVIDSLPYFDRQPTDDELDAADALIAAELAKSTFTKSTQTALHADIPALIPSRLSVMMEAEVSRVGGGVMRMVGGVDISRYESMRLPGPDEDEGAWVAAGRRHAVAAEAMRTRHANLAVLDRVGQDAWATAVHADELALAAVEADIRKVRKRTDAVNGARKRHQQEHIGQELAQLESEWKQLVSDNIEIAVANAVLEQEVHELQNR
ncbi:hypothetical protein PYCC9005_004507 [Savitreella phatthalungensis]